jgi:hypothetical protein
VRESAYSHMASQPCNISVTIVPQHATHNTHTYCLCLSLCLYLCLSHTRTIAHYTLALVVPHINSHRAEEGRRETTRAWVTLTVVPMSRTSTSCVFSAQPPTRPSQVLLIPETCDAAKTQPQEAHEQRHLLPRRWGRCAPGCCPAHGALFPRWAGGGSRATGYGKRGLQPPLHTPL